VSRGVAHQKEEMFFFEKKNKKAFADGLGWRHRGLSAGRRLRH
jgi:hypothetical protein